MLARRLKFDHQIHQRTYRTRKDTKHDGTRDLVLSKRLFECIAASCASAIYLEEHLAVSLLWTVSVIGCIIINLLIYFFIFLFVTPDGLNQKLSRGSLWQLVSLSFSSIILFK